MPAASVVYFILSHTNARQVSRLIRRIRTDSPASVVLVHHDAASEPFDFATFANDARVVSVERPLHGIWADFSLVEMVLAGFETLRRNGIRYRWIVLLSGQDYPVRPLREFEAGLEASIDGFLETDDSPGTLLDRYRFAWYRLPRQFESRVAQRITGYLTNLNGRQPYCRFLSGRVGCRMALRPREPVLPAGMQFFKGTQWWALSERAVEYVLAFIVAHPAFVRHYRERTIFADESFFHTILKNAAGFAFVNDDRRYTKWPSNAASSPDVLCAADVASIAASGAAFARKFDTRVDSGVLDAIDRLIDGTAT